MLFRMGPCSRRAKRRRPKRVSFPNKALICALCAALMLGLLFLAPQWLLVIIIILLSLLIAVMIKSA